MAGAADSTGFREAGGTDAGVPDAGAVGGGVSPPRPEVWSGMEGCPGLEPWPGGRIGAEGWPGAGADETWIESSRDSQTPRAGSSRRGVNAAGASGASAGREAGAVAWAAADAEAAAGAAAGLALGGSVAGG